MNPDDEPTTDPDLPEVIDLSGVRVWTEDDDLGPIPDLDAAPDQTGGVSL